MDITGRELRCFRTRLYAYLHLRHEFIYLTQKVIIKLAFIRYNNIIARLCTDKIVVGAHNLGIGTGIIGTAASITPNSHRRKNCILYTSHFGVHAIVGASMPYI